MSRRRTSRGSELVYSTDLDDAAPYLPDTDELAAEAFAEGVRRASRRVTTEQVYGEPTRETRRVSAAARTPSINPNRARIQRPGPGLVIPEGRKVGPATRRRYVSPEAAVAASARALAELDARPADSVTESPALYVVRW